MADIEISVVGQGAGGKMTLRLDWEVLGGMFAEASSNEQADFLNAVQTAFGDFESIAAELMQLSLIADGVPMQGREALRRWLSRLSDALDARKETLSTAEQVELHLKEHDQIAAAAKEIYRWDAEIYGWNEWKDIEPSTRRRYFNLARAAVAAYESVDHG